VIDRLRKVLSAALGRQPAESARYEHETEAGRRIEAARKRLKRTILPPAD